MPWSRPVPLIGDATSARERGDDPTAWAFDPADQDVLHQVIAARRDVRRFRPEPVPDDVLRRVLAAAHSAPSVGHSQPWRFVIVQDAGTRDRAALLADRERLAQAGQLDAESGRRLLDLQLEGIREAPLGVVVCCDRRTPAAGVLGRATFPDTDLWSCACAIQNLWLAARAAGLGLGWVTLFRPDDLAGLLHLPAGVVTLGWLCLGWPDERPPAPGLERVGWSTRAPLSEVVLRERWPGGVSGSGVLSRAGAGSPSGFGASPGPGSEGACGTGAADRDEPAPPPSRLRAPDQEAVVSVRDAADVLLTPPGSLGVLDRALDRVLALAHGRVDAGTLVLAGADHPVAALGVSAFASSLTREVMAAAVAGEALGVAAARSAGLDVLVVDAGLTGGPLAGALDVRAEGPVGDLVTSDALALPAVRQLLEAGRVIGRRCGATGLVALGEVGIGNTTVAAALTAGLLGLSAADVVGLGAGADSAMLTRKAEVVASALERVRRQHGVAPADSATLLSVLGGGEFAVLTGVVLGAAQAGAAVLLDGLATSVAALLAVRTAPAVAAHLIAGQRSRESAHARVLLELGLEPLLDLRLRAGEGAGACLAAGLLQAAGQTRAGTGRTA